MKKFLIILTSLILVFSLAACNSGSQTNSSSQTTTDQTSTPSKTTNLYTNLDQPALMEAISQYQGVCTVSTVNADGTPNLAVFVPGAVGDEYVVFGWAENATKANVLRDKKAVMSYDIVNLAAEEKTGRHTGAIVKLELVEDEKVLEELKAEGAISDYSVLLKITEVLPIG